MVKRARASHLRIAGTRVLKPCVYCHQSRAVESHNVAAGVVSVADLATIWGQFSIRFRHGGATQLGTAWASKLCRGLSGIGAAAAAWFGPGANGVAAVGLAIGYRPGIARFIHHQFTGRMVGVSRRGDRWFCGVAVAQFITPSLVGACWRWWRPGAGAGAAGKQPSAIAGQGGVERSGQWGTGVPRDYGGNGLADGGVSLADRHWFGWGAAVVSAVSPCVGGTTGRMGV